MARFASLLLLVALASPAAAAGGDMPPQAGIVFYLLLSVPAAVLGFVLGRFFRLPTAVLVLGLLAVIPAVAMWWLFLGREEAALLGLAAFVAPWFFAPALYLGWRRSRRDAAPANEAAPTRPRGY